MSMNVLDFQKMRLGGRKISMVTCYDHWSARILDKTPVDCVLVGDSVAMVVHGHPSTLHATTEMMALHTAAVTRGAPSKFVIADMPFPSFRLGIEGAMRAVDALMKAGAHAVKLEGVRGHEAVVDHIARSGVPVMGHLGLTPQSVHGLGGFRVQGRDRPGERKEADELLAQARALERLGCFSIVLECVPATLAREITEAVAVPTIGIGAGPDVSGQVLVLQDLLGMSPEFKPKFLKHYLSGAEAVADAIGRFDAEVKAGAFPSLEESYR